MVSKTFYAIYDVEKKKFKGRGNMSGVRWTDEPTQTYNTTSRATSAMNAHLKIHRSRMKWASPPYNTDKNLVVLPITVSWEEPK